ncbi:hypothetical protein [Streptomyces sp. CMB-StM0423]|uniref:hypothetical protein n=1 Tax=Streptomyces sp. CMB-StM0423 TaxID=2059884 RepID=UPI00131CEC9A|nr:hypothetical protein [Streptomyces sp. CMB-StM0423]
MDPGLAAVLGAVVGALGTGGAGIIAAIFSRSQAHEQLRAEHARAAREPRKVAYASYIEDHWKQYGRLCDARKYLAVWRDEGDEGESHWRQRAGEAYDAYIGDSRNYRHAQAQVYMEGPPSVISATVDLSGKLVEFADVVYSLAFEDTPQFSWEDLDEARNASYSAYLDFLYCSSDALAEDGI